MTKELETFSVCVPTEFAFVCGVSGSSVELLNEDLIFDDGTEHCPKGVVKDDVTGVFQLLVCGGFV